MRLHPESAVPPQFVRAQAEGGKHTPFISGTFNIVYPRHLRSLRIAANPAAETARMNDAHYHLLRLLDSSPQLTQCELAREMGVSLRDTIHVVDLAQGHLAALRYLDAQEGVLTVNLDRSEWAAGTACWRWCARSSAPRAVRCRCT
mgnify:CR=1 FL=1